MPSHLLITFARLAFRCSCDWLTHTPALYNWSGLLLSKGTCRQLKNRRLFSDHLPGHLSETFREVGEMLDEALLYSHALRVPLHNLHLQLHIWSHNIGPLVAHAGCS